MYDTLRVATWFLHSAFARAARSQGRCRPLPILTVGTILLLLFFPHAAKAQSSAQKSAEVSPPSASADYDKLLDRAVDAFEAQDYVRSRDLFEQAYAIRPNARVLRGLGISALHLEHFNVAKHELTEALRDQKQPLTANQRDGVKELLSWMQLNLGTLQLRLQPADAYITLDDEPIEETELVLKPGEHRISARLDGFASQTREVEVGAGQTKTLDVTLQPSMPESTETPAVSAAEAAAAAPVLDARETARSPFRQPEQAARDEGSSSVLSRWWFWTAVGVVVAGSVATTVVLTSHSPAKSYEQGGLGGVIMPLGRTP
jgi:tetratricopeptide (TPR) repeat protein